MSATQSKRHGARGRPPAVPLVAAGAVSIQLGAATAAHLFGLVGPIGAVTLRLVLASAALLGLVRPRLSKLAPSRLGPSKLGLPGLATLATARRADLALAVAFGLVLAGMNLAFYEAIARIPLGVAVTIEFSGPLALAIGTSRHRRDVLWGFLAGCGVFLLAGGHLWGGHPVQPLGIWLALVAGACWAGYIVLSAETARRSGASGLAVAMAAGALAILPFGIASAGARLVGLRALALGATVAILSSVLPYSLDLVALRRVSPRAFGVLLSMEPAIAALAGLVILGQGLTLSQVAALGLVVTANAGSSWFDSRQLGQPLPT